MKQATFNPFAIADADVVVSMMQDFYAIDNYPIDAAVSKTLFEDFTANQSLGRGWTILLDGEVMGYFILTFVFSFEYKGRIAFLDELYIAEKARGNGLGKQALDFMQQQVKLLSVKIVYLEVENHNTTAQKLYLSKNFNVHNRGLMKMAVS
jgi:ribosomal protein S18 acetylase RimI-like enzyme